MHNTRCDRTTGSDLVRNAYAVKLHGIISRLPSIWINTSCITGIVHTVSRVFSGGRFKCVGVVHGCYYYYVDSKSVSGRVVKKGRARFRVKSLENLKKRPRRDGQYNKKNARWDWRSHYVSSSLSFNLFHSIYLSVRPRKGWIRNDINK